MFSRPKISICIPVYKTENLLEACVNSVLAQNFKQMEIIIIDDGSYLENPAATTDSICKKLKRISKNPIKLIKHEKNQGLLEARRTAIYAAKGEYIFNLDSDDTLPAGSLNALFKTAQKTGADIIQGKANVVGNAEPELISIKEKGINETFTGSIFVENETSNPILDAFLLEQNIPGFLWGKLIQREVYLEALNRIPPITCTFAEDVIQSIWIYNYTRSFVSIPDKVYNYSIQSGISSKTMITDIARWEKVCTTSGVFTAIITECQENGDPFTEEQMNAIRLLCQKYVANNLIQLEKSVAPELQAQAYEMLCDYWGKGLVEAIKGKII